MSDKIEIAAIEFHNGKTYSLKVSPAAIAVFWLMVGIAIGWWLL